MFHIILLVLLVWLVWGLAPLIFWLLFLPLLFLFRLVYVVCNLPLLFLIRLVAVFKPDPMSPRQIAKREADALRDQAMRRTERMLLARNGLNPDSPTSCSLRIAKREADALREQAMRR